MCILAALGRLLGEIFLIGCLFSCLLEGIATSLIPFCDLLSFFSPCRTCNFPYFTLLYSKIQPAQLSVGYDSPSAIARPGL